MKAKRPFTFIFSQKKNKAPTGQRYTYFSIDKEKGWEYLLKLNKFKPPEPPHLKNPTLDPAISIVKSPVFSGEVDYLWLVT